MAMKISNRLRGGGLTVLAGLLLLVPGVGAQDVEERFPGVSLGLLFEGRTQPTIAIQPFTGRMGGTSAAARAEAIVARDLRYSNRFQVLDSLPPAMVRDDVDYALWDELGATWLVTGQIEGAGTGSVLIMEVHDVVYREVRNRARFALPDPSSPEFRMAVHVASDAVVQSVFDEPGIAATRIIFSRQMDDGSQDLWIVDSDGENLQRLTRQRADESGYAIALSPAWSPDGRRVAYVSYRTGTSRIYERDLDTGAEREIPAPWAGDYITPTYGPDGETLAFSVVGGARSGLYLYNTVRDCCLTNLTEGRWDDLSPSYSPDGNRLVFNSNRLGTAVPQIYLMPASGGQPSLVSPYRVDSPGYYSSPDWSPRGNRVAYHGRIERRGWHHILVSVVGQRDRIVRLTREGENEDPSWAPDGRHLVYVGVRDWGRGLFITDVETGATRTLVSGMVVRLPAWSPSLAPRAAQDGLDP